MPSIAYLKQTINSTVLQSFIMQFHLVSLNNEIPTQLACRNWRNLI